MTNYCAYQERCHVEVSQKIKEFKLIPEAKEKILLYLLEHNFLNETRFKIKKWGRIRIVKELKLRHISEYNIKKGLQEINEENYYESFQNYSIQKWQNLKNEPLIKAKQKFINYFQYRGWENQLIFDKLSELITNSTIYHFLLQ